MTEPTTAPTSVTIPAELAIGILNYLRSRPYAEVAAGVQALEAVLAPQFPAPEAPAPASDAEAQGDGVPGGHV